MATGMGAYGLSVWVHIIAAATWVGSMIFFATVAVPVLRREELRAAAPSLLRLLGARFRALGWIALGVLVMTGITNLYLRGIGWTLLCDPSFWATAFGRALAWKLALVAFVIAATGMHDLLTGSRALDAMETAPRSPAALRARRMASWL